MKHYAAQGDLFQGMVDQVNGEVLRDRGIEQVLSHNVDWKDECLAAFAKWDLPPTFTGEDLRLHWEAMGLAPAHSNGWGGLIMRMIKRKLIEPTGEYVGMKAKSSHARKTALYRRP